MINCTTADSVLKLCEKNNHLANKAIMFISGSNYKCGLHRVCFHHYSLLDPYFGYGENKVASLNFCYGHLAMSKLLITWNLSILFESAVRGQSSV